MKAVGIITFLTAAFWIGVLACFLFGCAAKPDADPSDAVNPLKLQPPLGGSAPKPLFAGGRTQAELPIVYHRITSWTFPLAMPANYVEFDVEGSTNLADWYLILTTNQPPAQFDSPNPNEAIRVGAHWIGWDRND